LLRLLRVGRRRIRRRGWRSCGVVGIGIRRVADLITPRRLMMTLVLMIERRRRRGRF
jgi:hypothetical protein